MKYFAHKQVVISFLLIGIFVAVGCGPVSTEEPIQQLPIPSSTVSDSQQLTQKFLPTVIETNLLTQLPIQTASPTVLASPSATSTYVPIALPTKTKRKHPEPPLFTPTLISTSTPSFTPAPISTLPFISPATLCPLPTPELLWVEPITSPTDQLSQVITVYIGNGVEVTITTESGTFTKTGNFGAHINPALVEIFLLPNTVHHIEVTAKVKAEGNGCIYAYVLTTTQDKQGMPLEIIQGVSYP